MGCIILTDKTSVFIDGGMISVLTKWVFPNPDGTPRKLLWEDFSKKLAKECDGELLRAYYYILYMSTLSKRISFYRRKKEKTIL